MSKFIKLTVIGDTSYNTLDRGKSTFVNSDHIVEFTQVTEAAGYCTRHTRIALATNGIVCASEDALWIANYLGWFGDSP